MGLFGWLFNRRHSKTQKQDGLEVPREKTPATVQNADVNPAIDAPKGNRLEILPADQPAAAPSCCPKCGCTITREDGNCAKCEPSRQSMSPTREQDVREKANYFRNPACPLTDIQDVIQNTTVLPKCKGIYGWYFDKIGGGIQHDASYVTVKGWTLLYVGIAGKNEASKSTLQQRIMLRHIDGTSAYSGLRLSLCCLFGKQYGFYPRPYDKEGKDIWFGTQSEKELRDWLVLHARLAWLTDERPWEIEHCILATYGNVLPLNTEKNPNNPFARRLAQLRDEARREARALRSEPEQTGAA